MRLLVLLLLLAGLEADPAADTGRAKAKISAEEMLQLQSRKRRDEDKDKLFTINSPRKNEPNQVLKAFRQ